jgi:flavin reductase (DIM6/NTAB) family NADH-FMN oxidoreductase RutF
MTKDENLAADAFLAHPGNYWKLLAARPVSVPVVAAEDERGPAGFLALSVSHVSANPPAMSVAIGKSTGALATITRAACFAISYLPGDASDAAEIFGGRRKVDGAERFAEGEWRRLATGAPVFNRAVLALDCALDRTFEYHGTVIAIGVIRAYSLERDRPILVSYAGGYRELQGQLAVLK